MNRDVKLVLEQSTQFEWNGRGQQKKENGQ